jgi:hypothetical protein
MSDKSTQLNRGLAVSMPKGLILYSHRSRSMSNVGAEKPNVRKTELKRTEMTIILLFTFSYQVCNAKVSILSLFMLV